MQHEIDPGKVLEIVDIPRLFDEQLRNVAVVLQKFSECFIAEMVECLVVDAHQFLVVVVNQHTISLKFMIPRHAFLRTVLRPH